VSELPQSALGAAALSMAAGLAVEHLPLMTAVQDLPRPARIELSDSALHVDQDEPAATRPFGLTDRELEVLRLLGQRKTNPRIAAALFEASRV
jgi:DNA-binding NarL/FixJ family response regulator